MNDIITQTFGNRLRLRVCGLLIEKDQILLLKHKGIGKLGYLWSPAGGGVQFGELIEDALKREFLEETSLIVEVQRFAFVYEYCQPPLHSVELFFFVTRSPENLAQTFRQGSDPELSAQDQMIVEIAMLSIEELQQIPSEGIHEVLRNLTNWQDLYDLPTYIKE
jgi:8-oxo-dGTP diphosphatase